MRTATELVAIAFVATGSSKARCEDRVRVGSELYSTGEPVEVRMSGGVVALADGVGGSRNGAFAAEFVLMGLRSDGNDVAHLATINTELLARTTVGSGLEGSATTLVLLQFSGAAFQLFSVGDSEVWLSRSGRLIRVNDEQSAGGSVLTSWFGGFEPRLDVSTDAPVDAIREGDRLLICSDGLLRCATRSEIRDLCGQEGTLRELADSIKDLVLTRERVDDVSFVLIELAHHASQREVNRAP